MPCGAGFAPPPRVPGPARDRPPGTPVVPWYPTLPRPVPPRPVPPRPGPGPRRASSGAVPSRLGPPRVRLFPPRPAHLPVRPGPAVADPRFRAPPAGGSAVRVRPADGCRRPWRPNHRCHRGAMAGECPNAAYHRCPATVIRAPRGARGAAGSPLSPGSSCPRSRRGHRGRGPRNRKSDHRVKSGEVKSAAVRSRTIAAVRSGTIASVGCGAAEMPQGEKGPVSRVPHRQPACSAVRGTPERLLTVHTGARRGVIGVVQGRVPGAREAARRHRRGPGPRLAWEATRVARASVGGDPGKPAGGSGHGSARSLATGDAPATGLLEP